MRPASIRLGPRSRTSAEYRVDCVPIIAPSSHKSEPPGNSGRFRWKDQPKRDRSELGARYSLIVTIETEAEDFDIWTPVAQEIGVPELEAEVEL